jgi:ATP-binding cassette subfamily B protein
MKKSYILNKTDDEYTTTDLKSLIKIWPFLRPDLFKVIGALFLVLLNSALNVYAPLLMGQIIDTYIVNGDKDSLTAYSLLLVGIYILMSLTGYLQIYWMGTVGQNVLFKLRDAIFRKIQSLPLSFFNVNRTGDLISRINNDTQKLNQAFSEVILRFVGNIFVFVGIGIYMVILNPKLGLVTLSVCAVLLVITRVLSPIIQKQNKKAFEKFGDLSSEVQESLNNFRVIVAFNRRKYFRDSFIEVNKENYKVSTKTSFLNALLSPIYDFAGNIAILIVLVVGMFLMMNGEITIGLMITFFAYTNNFYQPLKVMANLFSSLQASIAAWSRVNDILNLESDLQVIESISSAKSKDLVIFDNVSFEYPDGGSVLKNVSLNLSEGKTYALVGPTGGGKTTTASLMARLYDPTDGTIYFNGKDIRTFNPEDLSKDIGFILQEPILFTGSITDNIKYGNDNLVNYSDIELETKIQELNLEKILERFPDGLQTKVTQDATGISLGQKQLVAFLRILLREPKLLILDEATANIDTVTESLLQEILDRLPESTTKVIIAHRLNTIKNADEIFFIANGMVQKTVSLGDAVNMIENTKRSS